MPLAIGQTLQQRYQIQALLGQGGMGVVYRAYDLVLQRMVAIKVLPPQLTIDAEFVTRFQREAIASANLRHPHIVTVHDVGQQDGEYFIIMEYLEGSTLEQWLAAHGPMPMAQVSQVINQIAGALDHAHSRGIIHRDVKPSNIMLDAQGRAVLMDFGLVRAGEGLGPTRSTTVMGTPEYMAPEQILGQAIDRRTDIYALGVVIYELLSGKTPFTHTTPIATAYAHVHEAPPPLRSVNKAIPQSLEAVVLKALAKDPAARYQSAGDLGSDFAQAISGVMPAGLAVQQAAAGSRKQQSSSPAGGLATVVMSPAVSGPATPRRGRSKAGAFLVMGAMALIAVLMAAVLWSRGGAGDDLVLPTAVPVAVVMAATDTTTPVGLAPTAIQAATPTAAAAVDAAIPAVTPSAPPTRSPTATSVKTNTPAATVTPTRTPAVSATPTGTATRPVGPTVTPSAVPPTATPLPAVPLIALSAPQLLDPPDAEALINLATLRYSGVNGAASYVVETRSDRAGQQDWRRWPVPGGETSINLAFDALGEYFTTPGTVYYWRAVAVDAGGNEGPYSNQRSFVFQRPSPGGATTGAVLPVSPSTGELAALSGLLSIGFMLALGMVSGGIESPKDE